MARVLNQNRQSLIPNKTPVLRTMNTYATHHVLTDTLTKASTNGNGALPTNPQKDHRHHQQQQQSPTKPVIQPADTSNKRRRLCPLTIDEYEIKFRHTASDLELIERIFKGGIACNQLRAALWPYIFGLTKHRGKFERFTKVSGEPGYMFVEHEANKSRWRELKILYEAYQSQWKGILPDQELRFSAFRERKSLIERDVIRCDRLHPFYAEEPQNLTNLINLLMTYMMYDFDIGYLQGMSDLAAPILYVFGSDVVKSFWVFVEVMKLFRRNFEHSQKTIHFQLNCLYRLIKLTDVKLARHLRNIDCSNCFFVFRCIVCQFKRELMKGGQTPKPATNHNVNGNGNGIRYSSTTSSSSSSSASSLVSDDDDEGTDQLDDGPTTANNCAQVENNYGLVLNLWDTIWCVQRRHELLAKSKCVHTFTIAQMAPIKQEQIVYTKKTYYSSFDPNQANVPRFELTETEKFVLSLCMSLIRRERNQILTNQMDATEIHQHFIKPRLADDFDAFVEQAYEVYEYLNTDCDLKLLVRGADELAGEAITSDLSSVIGADEQLPDTYELLRDYLIISPTAYNISMTSLNNINQKGSLLSNGTPPIRKAGIVSRNGLGIIS